MLEFRKWLLVVAALVVVGAWAGPAPAVQKDTETKKGKRRAKLIAEEGAIKLMLLRHKSVRDDLKLNDKQAAKIRAYAEKQWTKAQKVADIANEKEREAQWKAMGQANQKFLNDMLSEGQRKRLEQIGMQVAGLAWVTRHDVARELKLTDDQKKKLHAYQKTAHEEMHAALDSSTPETRLRELGKVNRKRLWDLLTEEQKATWKRMRGEAFKGDLSKD